MTEEFLGGREEDFLEAVKAALAVEEEVGWNPGMVWLWSSLLLSLKNFWKILHRLLE